MPYFVWFGVLGLLLLYAAGITMFLAKRKNMPHLRRHHLCWARQLSALLFMLFGPISIIWVAPFPCWVDWAGCHFRSVSRVLCDFADAAGWRQEMEPAALQIQLLSMIIATVHAAWMIVRVLSAP